jgi:NADPH:quinone reductase-like Zn-dependent oxidoreductase
MKAIIVKKEDDFPLLTWEDAPDPVITNDDVLVEVKATAVNRADLLQAQGLYPPPPGVSDILGLEMAGVIAAIGGGVKQWKIGDRILALLPGGGYAQQATVDHQLLLPLPDDWSFAQGAAVPEVWLTAFLNLFIEGRLQPGETVLLHAGGSGVGTAGIQMAHAAGATV